MRPPRRALATLTITATLALAPMRAAAQATTLLGSLWQVNELLGRPTGYDLVKMFDIGPNLRKIYVVIRYNGQPLYARFLAYRPGREWQVNSVFWNTDPATVFPASLLAPP